MFGKLRQQRRFVTRHDKTVLSFECFKTSLPLVAELESRLTTMALLQL